MDKNQKSGIFQTNSLCCFLYERNGGYNLFNHFSLIICLAGLSSNRYRMMDIRQIISKKRFIAKKNFEAKNPELFKIYKNSNSFESFQSKMEKKYGDEVEVNF
jgi:hypothetical protein